MWTSSLYVYFLNLLSSCVSPKKNRLHVRKSVEEYNIHCESKSYKLKLLRRLVFVQKYHHFNVKEGYQVAKEYFLTLNRLIRNNTMWLLLILCSPIEDSKWKSISGIDENPNHNWSDGGGFICNRNVPRKDVTLIAIVRGTFKLKKIN